MRKSDLKHLLPASLLLASSTLALGQGSKSLTSPLNAGDAAQVAAEAARVLGKAKDGSALSSVREATSSPSVKRLEGMAEKALSTPSSQPSYADQARDAESQQRLKDAMTRVSPQGRVILAQNSTTPSLRTPGEGLVTSPGAKASPLSTDTPGPKPQPLRATPLEVQEKPAARTVIDAGESFFDSKAGFGVFVKDVVVDHPEFHLTCDELEVHMNKEAEPEGAAGADAGKAPATSGPTAGELAAEGAAESPSQGQAPSQRQAGGNIKTAIAKGRKVLINKMSAKGVPQTGIGREATYDGATGDMILRGWPQIQEGRNLTVATEPSTYFIIKANGRFYAQGGRHQTRIIQEDEKKAPSPSGAAEPEAGASAVSGVQTQGGRQ